MRRGSTPTLGLCLVLMSCACATYDPQAAALGCSTYASGTCQSYARCSATLLAPFASVEGCELELADTCTHSLQQPDVIGSGAGAAACGELMRDLDCNALLNNELPPGCQAPAGRRGDGAPCTVGSQCASTRCKGASGGNHGSCEEPAQLGEPCVGFGDCGAGLLCSAAGSCIALAPQGAACSDNQPCRAPLFCLDGTCAAELPVMPAVQVEQRDPQEECANFARALCTRYDACSTFLVAGSYGSMDACVTRTTQSCVDNLQLPDTMATALGVAGCAAALSAASCNAVLENALPEACQLVGGLRLDGQPCAGDAQCASTRCARASAGARCGACAALAQSEGACLGSSDCAQGLICTSDSKCRAPLTQAMPCDSAKPCALPLVCASGTCQPGLALGASCDPMHDACNPYAALSCNYTSMQCATWARAAPGQACGYVGSSWTACTGSAACKLDMWQGSCQAPVADGGSCAAASSCLAPARCSDGVCVLGSAGDCS